MHFVALFSYSICSILLFARTTEAGQLLVTAPSAFHYDNPEKVYVMKDQVVGDVVLYVQDYPNRRNTHLRQTLRFRESVAEVTLTITENMLPQDSHLVHDRVFLVVQSGAIKNEVTVDVKADSYNVLIQTDKPVYAPLDKAKIRVFVTDRNMIPTAHIPQIDIIDGKGELISRSTPSGGQYKGLYTSEHTFERYPDFGKWKVRANYGRGYHHNAESEFKVEQYVRPRINIKFEIDDDYQYVIQSDNEITFKVKARYVYDEEVEGHISTTLFLVDEENEERFRLEPSKPESLRDGQAVSFTIAFKERVHQIQNDFDELIKRYHLQIEATLIESSSGEVVKANSVPIKFVEVPFSIDFEQSKSYFRVGIRYVLQIHVLDHKGNPAKRKHVTILPKSFDNKPVEVDTDHYGNVAKIFNTKLVQSAVFEVTVKSRSRNKEVTAQSIFTIEKRVEDKSIGVIINRATISCSDKSLDVDLDFTERNAKVKATVLLVGRKRILQNPQIYTFQSGNGQATKTVNINLDRNLSPGARVVAFYSIGSKIVSDTQWVWIEGGCKEENVVLSTKKNRYQPRDQMTLYINTRENNVPVSVPVAMYGVDQALLNINDNKLTNGKIMELMLSKEHRAGSSFATTSNKCVLVNSGLSVLSASSNAAQQWKAGVTECDSPSRGRREINNGGIISIENSFNVTTCCNDAKKMVEDNPDGNCWNNTMRYRNSETVSTKCINTFSKCCYQEMRAIQEGRQQGHSKVVDEYYYYDDTILESLNDIRNDFKESLIWSVVETKDGETSMNVPLKDSITTWSLHGVALSAREGLAVSQDHTVVVNKDEFLEVHIPKRVSRGEVISLKVTLRNFADEKEVVFFLKRTKGMCVDARRKKWSHSKRRNAPENGAVTVTWNFVAMEVGKMEITVAALERKNNDRTLLDAVTKEVTVRYEGQEVVETVGSFILDEHHTEKRVALRLPTEMVQGSERSYVQMIGDVLLPATVGGKVKNLFGKLRMPAGCGEQTMIRVGPTVYVALYLRETGQLVGKLEKDVKNKIRKGIEHMLKYKKKDGSYSVWANRLASTWLTAFTAKVFAQAAAFNPVEYDIKARLVCPAVTWLTGQQRLNGQFNENYQVVTHHKEMTGGVDTKSMASAFALITMLESECNSGVINRARSRAITYLESVYGGLARDARREGSYLKYSLALTTYALSLAKSNKAKQALNLLKQVSEYNAGEDMRYWPIKRKGSAYWYRQPKVIEVELAGYALLAFLAGDDFVTSNGIVRWLIEQRSTTGAFVSTQDTVVAMQALSEYSMKTKESGIQMQVETNSLNGQVSIPSIEFNNQNFMVRKKYEVSEAINDGLVFRAKAGDIKGKVVVQVELRYNRRVISTCNGFNITVSGAEIQSLNRGTRDTRIQITNEPDADSIDYDDDVNVGPVAHMGGRSTNDDNVSKMKLTIPVDVKALGKESGMSIIRVNLISGFEITPKGLRDLQNHDFVENVEYIDGEAAIIYMEKIPTKGTRLILEMRREEIVEETNPVTIDVYDYYDLDRKCSTFYDATNSKNIVNGRTTPHGFKCLEGLCPDCYAKDEEEFDDNPDLEEPKDRDGLRAKACVHNVHFVYVVEIDEIEYDDETGMNIYTTYIDAVLKNGNEPYEEGDELELQKVHGCSCPGRDMFQEKKIYLVMGKEVTSSSGEITYLIDDTSYVQEWDDDNPHLAYLKEKMQEQPCDD